MTHAERFQQVVSEATPFMAHLVAQVENCLPGPNREAVLHYLRELHGLVAETLTFAEASNDAAVRSHRDHVSAAR